MDVLFEALLANRANIAATTAAQRSAKLQRLAESVLRHRLPIRAALASDHRRHPSEVDLTEIYPVLGEIKHARKHLARWMKPKGVPTPLALAGARSWIQWQPKGTALILSPWNFPVNLTLGPLVSAVAAGNTVMLKPSEHTPHATEVIKSIVRDVFDKDEVVLVEGDAEVAKEALRLPFQHIFFTGAPAIGKDVMRAAAAHLASVTLELGGKSPTIVDPSADLANAARRIAWSKWMNNGQVCIAPDHVWVHESRHDDLVAALGQQVRKFFGSDVKSSPSYSRLINGRQFDRVAGYLEGTDMQVDPAERYIQPSILAGVGVGHPAMKEEIFGPVLPVLRYRDLDEPLNHINAGDKPLALYLYSQDQATIDRVLKETRAGGTCINHSGVQFSNLNLPFGGDNVSGIGKSHGEFGFQEFSNARAVMHQRSRFSPIDLMTPPFGSRWKQALIDLTLRWL